MSTTEINVRKGQRVIFRPEWQDEGDAEITFIATEDSNRGRVEVVALLGLPFNPRQIVSVDMIERVEDVK